MFTTVSSLDLFPGRQMANSIVSTYTRQLYVLPFIINTCIY